MLEASGTHLEALPRWYPEDYGLGSETGFQPVRDGEADPARNVTLNVFPSTLLLSGPQLFMYLSLNRSKKLIMVPSIITSFPFHVPVE